MSTDAMQVAKAALLELHGLRKQELCASGWEANILRCIIEVTCRQWDASQTALPKEKARLLSMWWLKLLILILCSMGLTGLCRLQDAHLNAGNQAQCR